MRIGGFIFLVVLITKFLLASVVDFFTWVDDPKNKSLKIEKENEKLSKKSRLSVVFDEDHLCIVSTLFGSKDDVLVRE